MSALVQYIFAARLSLSATASAADRIRAAVRASGPAQAVITEAAIQNVRTPDACPIQGI